MPHRKFFYFPQEISSRTKIIEGGYLSFLPLSHHYHITEQLDGIFIEGEEYVLLELKGNVDPDGLRIDLRTKGVRFWQLYQFMNSSQIQVNLDDELPMCDNRCISFSADEPRTPWRLNEGKHSAVLIGYKTNAITDLLTEFPMLSTLVYGDGSWAATSFWEPDMSINHSLRGVWNHIREAEYRPLRGKGELLLKVCKLLEEYCRQLDRQADQSERSMLGLYHKALAYIRENILDAVSKEKIAEALGVSPRTLNRAFEKRPIKIADYIQEIKLASACDLLYEGDITIEQISNLLNYPNRRYFSREFKKYLFVSPTSFKREMEALKRKAKKKGRRP